MKINIRDVAKEANVSMSTVSRVINNNYPVKAETKKRVDAAIKKLNFSPNILARSLVHQNTKTIGVIAPSINNLFFPTVIKGIEHILRTNEYSIYLCDTDDKAEDEVKYIKSLLGRQVDGIISIDPKTENMKSGFYEGINNDIPLVCINGYNKNIKCNFVLNDEVSGAQQAMEYLIDLGHKNIIFIRGEKSNSYDLKEKVYKKILEENGLIKSKKIVDIGEGNSDETVENTMNIIYKNLQHNKDNFPIAFFTCNDLIALGVMNACKRSGYDVPNDVSIIGFDNISISSLVEPKLTTVDQNMCSLGENAANMILDIIRSKDKNLKKVILNTNLIIRNSCIKTLP
ncbi:LacI family DNA-binding transcriptional regulator [Clostridium sp.]|jgi:LacI family transcriptional regulator|uniref:LacI family DNA-binding transcriptional regulator n=1 Tax=Clostridium sp. TaxID=1506 RepID=UPI0025853596|nr:LacI family DNA-binding transcriptional regulator [Clostridium sp.]MDF2504755.1 transcriptional regulator [Clostridium sp.]